MFLCFVLLPLLLLANEPEKTQAPPAVNAFLENNGQVVDQFNTPRTDIDFKLGTEGLNIFIANGAIHYQWLRSNRDLKPPDHHIVGLEARETYYQQMREDNQLEAYRLDVMLLGANPRAELIKEEKQFYFENYYLPRYKGTVSSYNKIIYKDIYPNIDWVLYISGSQLKYDFIVRPGGNPRDIRLQYSGATELAISDGALVAKTPLGQITEQRPYTYDAATKAELTSSFVLSGNILSFDIATSGESTLVIDPALEWATYYSSNTNSLAWDVASNSAGDVFMVGTAGSSTDIATTGAHQTVCAGQEDGFMVKFNTAGTRIWATYLGGTGMDELTSVSCDNAGNIYTTGATFSTNLATPGAYQDTMNSTVDILLSKFNANGKLLWSTYFGGEHSEFGYATCDSAGNIYLAGKTWSHTGIVRNTTHQTSNAGVADAFLSKWDAAGNLVWATYYGGTYPDEALGVTCDATGNIYMAGYTQSSTGIATPGAYQDTITTNGSPHPNEEGFLSKWTPAGNLVWATYFGGEETDVMIDLACDLSGNIYATGYASSLNLATPGTYQTTLLGTYDAILLKFASTGNLQWATYYGGEKEEYPGRVDIGTNGLVYLSGYTSSKTGIATLNSFKTTMTDTTDSFLVEFNPSGDRTWGTYFGGPKDEPFSSHGGLFWNGIAATNAGKICFVGNTISTAGIATPGAHQTQSIGGVAAFLTSWTIDTAVYISQPFTDTSLCLGQHLMLVWGTTYRFLPGNVFTVQLSDAQGSFAAPDTIGTKADIDSGFMQVTIPAHINPGTGYRLRIVGSHPGLTSPDNGFNIRIKPLPQLTAASNSPACEGATLQLLVATTASGPAQFTWTGPEGYQDTGGMPALPAVTQAMAGEYIVNGTVDGCFGSDTTLVNVKAAPAPPFATSNSPLCVTENLRLSASSGIPGVTYYWTGPQGFKAALQDPVIARAEHVHAGVYRAQTVLDDCYSVPSEVEVLVTDMPTLSILASPGPVVCQNQLVEFSASPIRSGAEPEFQWFKNQQAIPAANSISYTEHAPLSGDSYYCQMSAKDRCSEPVHVNSNTISTTVLPMQNASLQSIQMNPDYYVDELQELSFTAQVIGSDSLVLYRWLKNDKVVAETAKNIWTTRGMLPDDQINVILIPNHPCLQIDNATDTLVVPPKEPVILYPNPNNGSFTVKGIRNTIVHASIVNVLGQVVYSKEAEVINELRIDAFLSTGIYLLKLTNYSRRHNRLTTFKFSVTE